MALINIPNQIVRFTRNLEGFLDDIGSPNHCRTSEYSCLRHEATDPIRLLWKQTPCGDPVNSCQEFNDVGAEVLSNGDFSSGSTGWTVTGNWGVASNIACHTAGATGQLLQNFTQLNLFTMYRLRFTISAYSAGTVQAIIGSALTTSNIAQAGTFDYFFIGALPATSINFAPSSDFVGCVDDISIVPYSSCWVFNNTNFSFGEESGVCHTPDVAATTATQSFIIKKGQYYKVEIKISDSTAGTVSVAVDTVAPTFSGNGVFSGYVYNPGPGDNTALGNAVVTMSIDFDGCIEYVKIYEMRMDHACFLLDEDGNKVGRLNEFLNYIDDFILLSFDGFISVPNFNGGSGVPYGCYRIGITDPCLDTSSQYSTNLILNPNFNDSSIWTVNGNWAISAGAAVATTTGSPPANNQITQPNSGFTTGVYYDLTYFNKCSNFGANEIKVFIGGTLVVSSQPPELVYGQVVAQEWQIVNALDPVRFEAIFASYTAGRTIHLDTIVAKISARSLVMDYVSSPICYKESFPDTYLIVGDCTPDDASAGYSFGMLWYSGFTLTMRAGLLLRSPRYPTQFNKYYDSIGVHKKSFVAAEKTLEMVFDEMGEVQHDCIRLIINCKLFSYVTRTGQSWFLYNLSEEYSPDWDESGFHEKAGARILVQHRTDVVKHTIS